MRTARRSTTVFVVWVLLAGSVVAACGRAAPSGPAAPVEITAAPSAGVSLSAIPADYGIPAGKPQPVKDRVILGAYLKLDGYSQDQSLKLRREQLGRNMNIVQWFYLFEDKFPANYPTTA